MGFGGLSLLIPFRPRLFSRRWDGWILFHLHSLYIPTLLSPPKSSMRNIRSNHFFCRKQKAATRRYTARGPHNSQTRIGGNWTATTTTETISPTEAQRASHCFLISTILEIISPLPQHIHSWTDKTLLHRRRWRRNQAREFGRPFSWCAMEITPHPAGRAMPFHLLISSSSWSMTPCRIDCDGAV